MRKMKRKFRTQEERKRREQRKEKEMKERMHHKGITGVKSKVARN